MVHEVHSLSQQAAKLFSFPYHGDLPGRTPNDLIRGSHIIYQTSSYIANPTSIAYFNRVSKAASS